MEKNKIKNITVYMDAWLEKEKYDALLSLLDDKWVDYWISDRFKWNWGKTDIISIDVESTDNFIVEKETIDEIINFLSQNKLRYIQK